MNPSLRFRPTFETLEHRACPAFFAGLVNGNLVVTATEAVALIIEQQDADTFAVSDRSGPAIAIDGVTRDLEIHLSDQDDSLEVALFGQTASVGMRVNLGGGNDSLTIGSFGGVIGGDLDIHGGPGDDYLLLADPNGWDPLRLLGRVGIHGGEGNDNVQLGLFLDTRFAEEVQIHLGQGDDVLSVSSALFFSPAKAYGGGGIDEIIGSHVNLTARSFE